MENPLLSIVMPTYNRAENFLITVPTMLKYKYENFEMIIHDCSDSPLEDSQLSKIKQDSRVNYIYCPERLSMAENFSKKSRTLNE